MTIDLKKDQPAQIFSVVIRMQLSGTIRAQIDLSFKAARFCCGCAVNFSTCRPANIGNQLVTLKRLKNGSLIPPWFPVQPCELSDLFDEILYLSPAKLTRSSSAEAGGAIDWKCLLR